MSLPLYFLLILPMTWCDEATPSNLRGPGDFNYHPYRSEQYLKEVQPEPTKNGPVVFPNDAPPPPKTPLVVTSRPLIESIRRSNLNPEPDTNNSIPSSSQLNHVTFKPEDYDTIPEYSKFKTDDFTNPGYSKFKPDDFTNPGYSKFKPDDFTNPGYSKFTPEDYASNAEYPKFKPDDFTNPEYSKFKPADFDTNPEYSKFKPDVKRFEPIDESIPYFRLKPEYSRPIILGRTKDYKPFVYPVAPGAGFNSRVVTSPREGYGGYEDHSALPPIYKAIADHAQQKVQKLQLKKEKKLKAPTPNLLQYGYQVKEPQYGRLQDHHHDPDHHEPNHHRYDHSEDDDPTNYAFSYKVRDHLTGDDFSHSQHSRGSATNGEYRVRLPDGRMQIVSYTADEHGYKADVRYDDEDKMKGNTLETHDDYKFGGGKHHHDTQDFNHYNNDLNSNYIADNNYKFKPDYRANNDNFKSNNHDYKVHEHKPPYEQTNLVQKPELSEYKNYPDHNLLSSDYFAKNDYRENKQGRGNEPIIVSDSYKPEKEKDFNQYSDVSNEYNTQDYSLEYDNQNHNYDPHKSKFSLYTPKPDNSELSPSSIPTTARPLYEELKKIFATKNPFKSATENLKSQVEINVPSTTPSSLDFGTTEHVVVIGTKPAYNYNLSPTNIGPSPTPLSRYTTSEDLLSNLTPGGYLVNTIANLKKGEKPVLSSSFIDRINKYLSFK